MTLSHVYPQAGEYVFTATAEWTDPVSGLDIEEECSKLVVVTPYTLTISTSMVPSSNILAGETVTFTGNVPGGLAGEVYAWTWIFYNPAGEAIDLVMKNSSGAGNHNPIEIAFPGPSVYSANIYVYGNMGSGEKDITIDVGSAPKCLYADIYGPSETGTGNTVFYAVADYYEYPFCTGCEPTTQRWSVISEAGVVLSQVINNATGDEWQNDSYWTADLNFPASGNYTVRLEVYDNDGGYTVPVIPANYHMISCYQIDDKDVTVNSNMPVINVYDADNDSEEDIFCPEQAVTFNIANTSGGSFHWYVVVPDNSMYDWVTIQGATGDGKTLSGNGNAQVTLLVTRNTGSNKRWVGIDISADNTSVTRTYFLRQHDCEGPLEQNEMSGESNSGDKFGYSVAIEGIYAVVGAPLHDHSSKTDAGAAYVLKRIEGDWQKIAKLTASDAVDDDFFGCSVDISGEYIVVGARGNNTLFNWMKGCAYLYKKPSGGEWTTSTQTRKLVRPSSVNNGAEFGCDVAISGDWAVVGARYGDFNGNKSGGAFIYFRNRDGSDQWGRVTYDFFGTNNKDYFGYSVDIDVDVMAIGAPADGETNGYVKVYERNQGGINNWGYKTTFVNTTNVCSGIENWENLGDDYGLAVSVSSNQIAIGSKHYYKWCPWDNWSAFPYGSCGVFGQHWIDEYRGSADVKKRNSGTWSNWHDIDCYAYYGLEQTMHNDFGRSVGIYDDMSVIGQTINPINDDYGIAKLYNNETGNSNIIPYNTGASYLHDGDQFGYSVGISQGIVAAGMPGRESSKGSVHFADYTGIQNMQDFSVCDIDLLFTHFTKVSGTYEDVVAGTIEIGGTTTEGTAVYESDATITYTGSEITMTTGFWAKEGSNFTARYSDCEDHYTTNSGVLAGSKSLILENDNETEKPGKGGVIPLVYNKGEKENTVLVVFKQKPGIATDIEMRNCDMKVVYAINDSFERKFTIDFSNLQPGEYEVTAQREGKKYRTEILYLPQIERYFNNQYTYNEK
ncbi:MAG: FG-GAP repeat protein [Bacteroidetes bacterium]|nr:FG-GAP repeat protein [Bacteroidota bacterium]